MSIFDALKNVFKNKGEVHSSNSQNRITSDTNNPINRENRNTNDSDSRMKHNSSKVSTANPISKPKTIASSKVSFEYNIDPIYTKVLPIGLLPGEILLIDWISGKHEDVVFPRYFETEYGIDAKRSLKKLIKEHYVSESSSYESLNSFRVSDLKEILKTKQLKVGGNKSELLTRIQENFQEDEVIAFIQHPSLMPTEKGQEALEDYYYIVPAHRNNSKDGIYNVANAIRKVYELDYRPNNGDISWILFQEAYMKYGKKFKYGLMRNVIFSMAKQLSNEGKYVDSLHHYFRVFIFDSSGLSNSRQVDHPKIMMFNMPAASSIKKVINHLELDEEELFEHFSISWDKTRGELLFHYFTGEECFTCLKYALEDDEDRVKEILFEAYKRLEENYDTDTFRNEFKVDFPVDYQKLYKDE